MGSRVVLGALLALALVGCGSGSNENADAAPGAAAATNLPPAADKPRAGVAGPEGGAPAQARGGEGVEAMPSGG